MTATRIHRPTVPIGACTTLSAKSRALGGSTRLLQQHRTRGTLGFPEPVAQVGGTLLFVEAELDAFYDSVRWRQADRAIRELLGDDVPMPAGSH